jgi:hypothetical protein
MSEIKLNDTQLEALNADGMMDINIDDVADLEGYQPLPAGLFTFVIAKCGMEVVGNEDKPTIRLDLELTSCVELVKESDRETLPEFPRNYKENFFLETKKRIGLKAFITMMRPIAMENGWTTPAAIIVGCVGFGGECLIKKGGYNKKNEDGSKGEWFDTNNIDPATVVFG